MGTADFTTRKLVDKVDFNMTYANGLTSTVVGPTHMPTVLNTDYDAIRAAIKTCNALDVNQARVVRIQDTLQLETIMISEALVEEALKNPNISMIGDPEDLCFDSCGNLSTTIY